MSTLTTRRSDVNVVRSLLRRTGSAVQGFFTGTREPDNIAVQWTEGRELNQTIGASQLKYLVDELAEGQEGIAIDMADCAITTVAIVKAGRAALKLDGPPKVWKIGESDKTVDV